MHSIVAKKASESQSQPLDTLRFLQGLLVDRLYAELNETGMEVA
jgi:hypothetical protein